MFRKVLLCLSLACVATPGALADTLDLATGLDASNNVITSGGVNDAHWTVDTDPFYSPTGIPQTVFPGDADSGDPSWVSNGPNSDWIARNAGSSDNGPAPYSFTRTFDLTGYDPTTATITNGAWTIDDAGSLYLNGNLLSSLADGSWGSLYPFTAPSSDFVSGINTLTMTITYDDQFLDGARFEGILNVNPVPEPSSLALGFLGATGLGLAARRRLRVR